MGNLTELQWQKLVLNFFTVKSGSFSLKFCIFRFFLYDLFTKKARKLEVAESNPILDNIPSSLSVSLSLSLSLSLSFG